jgi:uncharacterized protein (DUF2147 family)
MDSLAGKQDNAIMSRVIRPGVTPVRRPPSTVQSIGRVIMRLNGIGCVSATLAGICLLLVQPLTTGPASGQAEPNVSGLWLDNEGKAAIEVKNCGTEVCGSIVWLKQPLDPNGKPWTDILNPDRSKKRRPVCGLQIIGGLKPGANGLWQDGWIYDPEEGKSFNVELSLADTNTLKVFGFAGIRMLSETFHWKRLPAESARCKA